MNKLLIAVITITLIISSFGCTGTTTQPEKEALKSVPSGFYKKYEEAEFSKFNSYASENGLGGSKIWLEGSFSEINTIDSEDMTILFVIITDTNDNEWLLALDVEELTSIEVYNKLLNHQVLVTGVYDGYCDVYDKPIIYLSQLYDRVTGNITTSSAFSYMSEEGSEVVEPEPEEPQQRQEETSESEKEDKNETIRPEVKEAIDSYEAFIDEYIAFMNKYSESDNSASMLVDYLSFMSKMESYSKKMDKLESELNDKELIYFYEVISRCNIKLMQSL